MADILVVAVGKPGLIPGAWVKPGAVVVDVGITRQPDGTLHGDVDFAGALARAAYITPGSAPARCCPHASAHPHNAATSFFSPRPHSARRRRPHDHRHAAEKHGGRAGAGARPMMLARGRAVCDQRRSYRPPALLMD